MESLRNLQFLYKKGKNGGHELNEIFRETSPFFLAVDESAGDSFVLVPANSSIPASMSNDRSGVIDIRSLTAIATSDEYMITINDTINRRDLSNQPIHAKTILGKSGRDFELPFPLFLDQNQTLYLTLLDLSGAPNTIRPTFIGVKYFFKDALEVIKKNNPDVAVAQPYFYTTNSSVTLTALGTYTAYINCLYNADFLLKKILSYSTGNYKFKISNIYTNKNMTSGWIHSSLLGSAEYNKIFDGLILERKTQLKIEFVDLSGAPNNVYLTLSGINYWVD